MKVYRSDSFDPYTNLAQEYLLMKALSEREQVLYLWQNDHTIVIGKHQNVWNECKAEDFLSSGGKIARRLSGGGAVYHDLGNLNFSILGNRAPIHSTFVYELLQQVLKILNIDASFNGRNDLLVNGKKVSGNAAFQEREFTCHHGTVLVSCNFENMLRYLTPEKSKLERNGVSSVASRVENLSSMDPSITVEKVCQAFLQVIEPAETIVKPLDSLTREYRARFENSEWIYGGTRF